MMNTTIHRKQIIMLVLSMALAIGSYWIPLPPESHTANSAKSFREEVVPPASIESISFAHEPITTWRFPITVRTSSTAAQPDGATTLPDDRAWPVKHLIELKDLSNDESNRSNNFFLVPITDRSHSSGL